MLEKNEKSYFALGNFNLTLKLVIGLIVMIIGSFIVIINKNNFGWIPVTFGGTMALFVLEIWQNGLRIKCILEKGKLIRFEKG